jgi:hypothetical protein
MIIFFSKKLFNKWENADLKAGKKMTQGIQKTPPKLFGLKASEELPKIHLKF